MLYAPRERGQGLTEYAIVIVLIAVLLIGSLVLLRDAIEAFYSRIASAIPH